MLFLLRHLNKPVYHYISVIFISFFIMFWSLQLWDIDLSIPIAYAGDGLLHGEIIKGIIDNGWYLNNSYTGAPYGQELYDFPFSDALFMIMFNFFSFFTSNYAVIFNVFYLLGFILTPFTSMLVMRHFKVSYLPALMSSILFSYIPYHFLRLMHLHLAAYFIIPLIVMVILWVTTDEKTLFFNDSEKKNFKLSLKNKKVVIAIIISVLIGASGVYYAFFACILLAFSIVISLFLDHRIKRISGAIMLIAMIAITVVLNILPNAMYILKNGSNVETAVRGAAESEIYGLKISQLLIPVSDHGIGILSKIKQVYSQYPLSSEGSSYLGVAGILGFFILLLYLFKPRGNDRSQSKSILSTLSLLNIGVVLVASIGGFGSLFALLVSPQIRAYNRISVFISFLCLLALALFIDKMLKRYNKRKAYQIVISLCILILLIFGVWEQTDKAFVPNYSAIKAEFQSDEAYFKQIENILPTDSMILQLPYVPFPENPHVYKMSDYEHFKGYLHSDTLRWSYGAMKGRDAANWLRNVSMEASNELVQKASYAGFKGIYIDRFGYEDSGAGIEKELAGILQESPLESEDKRRSFFSLVNYNEALRSQLTKQEWNELYYDTMHPIMLEWRGSALEITEAENWRWFPNQAVLDINNMSKVEKTISLEMYFSTGDPAPSTLSITSSFLNEQLPISQQNQKYTRVITIPPGKHEILFESSANRLFAPGDPRYLVFRVVNFKWENINN